ncbi:MAG: NUDIX domain-containing protein [Defluviitaleaceae bacterium]|nr:NUDIX domain-containing protein [Defluviitaleaceae bacterium]
MTELFDILDINGAPTGATAAKGTPLENGQFYLGIHAYIYNPAGEFLLQQRSYNKAFLPGGWDVVLEHVIAGESSLVGAIRGIREEVGLKVSKEDMDFTGRIIWNDYHHIIDIYFLKTDIPIEDLSLQNEEVIGVKLVTAIQMLEHVSKMDYRPAEYRSFITNEIKKRIKTHI